MGPRASLRTEDRKLGDFQKWTDFRIGGWANPRAGLEIVNWRIMGLRTGLVMLGSLRGFEIPSGNRRTEG